MSESAAEPDLPPPPVPVREKGYAVDSAGAAGWWANLTRETTPELMWPHSIGVFDRMRKQDAQVSSVLRAVTSPILRTRWALDPDGVDPEVASFVSSNLGLPLRGEDPGSNPQAALRGRDRFSFIQHLRLALLFLPFGHMPFEQVYRYDPQGRARIRKLAPRMPHTISRFNVAQDGGLVSIEQYPAGPTMRTDLTIPVNRLVVYVLDLEGGNWPGTSVLRSAYKNWLLKDRALRTWSGSIDRNGMGLPFYKAGTGEKDLTAGRKIAQEARSGDNSGAAGPEGADLELKGVTGTLPDINKFVRYQDEQIARAVLAHFLNLGTQTGSWALGSTFADFFTLSLQAVAEDFRDTFTSHVIEDLVDINFGRTVPAPQLVFEEIGSRGQVDDELSLVRRAAGLEDDAALADFLRTNLAADQEAS